MLAPPEIVALVERFMDNRDDYKSDLYNEARVRREFIDPLLRALGWDVDNTAGYGEAYKDVVHEDALRIEGSPKAPDYAIRVVMRNWIVVFRGRRSLGLSWRVFTVQRSTPQTAALLAVPVVEDSPAATASNTLLCPANSLRTRLGPAMLESSPAGRASPGSVRWAGPVFRNEPRRSRQRL